MTYAGRRSSGRGFTLIEIMAALVIFGVAIVGFMQAMGESTRIQSDLLTQERAMLLAQNVLEEMRFSGKFEEGTEDGAFSDEDAIFHWRTEIEENARLTGLLDVTVTIAWNDGLDRDFRLSTQMLRTEQE